MKHKCTLLVCSCDTYEDTWYPFFKILSRRWENLDYPIVLNTESKSFSYPGLNITTYNFYKEGEKVPWGKRLKRTLKEIDSEYILFMLDDFFLLKDVDSDRIEDCMKWMDQDPTIAVFSFWRTRGNNIKDGKYPHFELRPQKAQYRLNCQAAIWRKSLLEKYIRNHESPWDWEIFGSERSSRYKEKFYSAIEGEPYIMDYIIGGGIHRGRWIYEARDLFNQYDINLDYTVRGFKEELNDVLVTSNNSFFMRVKRKICREWRHLLSIV